MSMQVLVCDDDRSTRFIIRRLLTQRLGCGVIECGDGVEALEILGSGPSVDLVILDINMPTLDGVDVVEAIRRTPHLAHLPVIMLSHERREEVVVKLIHLGIFGYVTKPPAADTLVALVERVRKARTSDTPLADIRLDAETPALVVDGDADYREFFKTQAEPYGKALLLESGLGALAAFKREPARLVFVGSQLGVVGRDLLVRKMREMCGDQPLRIVELREADDQAATTLGADEVMPRTVSIADHRAALRRFVRATGPATDLSSVIGDLGQLLTSALNQALTAVLEASAQPGAGEIGVTDVCGTLDVTVRHQFTIRLDVCQSKQAAMQAAAAVRSIAVAAVTSEDITTAWTEVMTAVRGRLQTAITAKQVEFACSMPRIRQQEAMEIDVPQDGYGLQLPFTLPDGAAFTVLASVARSTSQAVSSATHAA